MEQNDFVKEVYRRMALFNAASRREVTLDEMIKEQHVIDNMINLKDLLPTNKDANILDIGFGAGTFMAACIELGYQNIFGADFGITNKSFIKKWSEGIRDLYEIETNIGDLLSGHKETYDFIHMSHVIEHIPKHSLLYVTDALYYALRKNGALLLRTPNMEGPCAMSSLFVSLGHEYGFCGSNLSSLLNICGFDDVNVFSLKPRQHSFKQKIGVTLRQPTFGAELDTDYLELILAMYLIARYADWGTEEIISHYSMKNINEMQEDRNSRCT